MNQTHLHFLQPGQQADAKLQHQLGRRGGSNLSKRHRTDRRHLKLENIRLEWQFNRICSTFTNPDSHSQVTIQYESNLTTKLAKLQITGLASTD